MTRSQYLDEVIRLYLGAPDTPDRPARNDWAIASDLFRRAIPLEHIDHAIRVATLRRLGDRSPTRVHSLAYYRTVLDRLEPGDLDPDYIDYVRGRSASNTLTRKRG